MTSISFSPVSGGSAARRAALIGGILLIAMNLRVPITSVAPVLDQIRQAFSLSSTEAGMLITLPLLAFAVVSPLCALLAREYGLERSLFMALVLIAAGVLTRSAGPVWCLYVGTLVLGSGIAIGNVLLPSLLKRDFPKKITQLTAVYALAMGIAAAVGSVAVIPFSQSSGMGWRFGLGIVVVIPLITGVVWLTQLHSRSAPAKGTAAPPHGGPVWHSLLAWQVTLFIGLNSFVYYVAAAWLPGILAQGGYSPEQAGNLHGVMQLASALPGFLLVPLIGRMRDQRLIAFTMSALAGVGLLGLWLAPGASFVWVILYGFGAGAALILGLAFVSLRSAHSQQAASLSGMAQCVGYLLAAVGPMLAGVVHDMQGGWGATLGVCAALCMVTAGLGLFCGRSVQVGA